MLACLVKIAPDYLGMAWVAILGIVIWHTSHQCLFLYQGEHLPFVSNSPARWIWFTIRLFGTLLLLTFLINPLGIIPSEPPTLIRSSDSTYLEPSRLRSEIIIGYLRSLIGPLGLLISVMPLWHWQARRRWVESCGMVLCGSIGIIATAYTAWSNQLFIGHVYLANQGIEIGRISFVEGFENGAAFQDQWIVHENLVQSCSFLFAVTIIVACLSVAISRTRRLAKSLLFGAWCIAVFVSGFWLWEFHQGSYPSLAVHQLSPIWKETIVLPDGWGIAGLLGVASLFGLIVTLMLGRPSPQSKSLTQSNLNYYSLPPLVWFMMLAAFLWPFISFKFGNGFFLFDSGSYLLESIELPMAQVPMIWGTMIGLLAVQSAALRYWNKRNIQRIPINCVPNGLWNNLLHWGVFTVTLVLFALATTWFAFTITIHSEPSLMFSSVDWVEQLVSSAQYSSIVFYGGMVALGLAATFVIVRSVFAFWFPKSADSNIEVGV